jgi:hypothetical protein
MDYIVSRAPTAWPRDVVITPRPIFVDPLVSRPFLRRVRLGKSRIPSRQILLHLGEVVAVQSTQPDKLLPDFLGARLFLAPDFATFAQNQLVSCINQQVFMTEREKFSVVFPPFFPSELSDEVLLTKYFGTKLF